MARRDGLVMGGSIEGGSFQLNSSPFVSLGCHAVRSSGGVCLHVTASMVCASCTSLRRASLHFTLLHVHASTPPLLAPIHVRGCVFPITTPGAILGTDTTDSAHEPPSLGRAMFAIARWSGPAASEEPREEGGTSDAEERRRNEGKVDVGMEEASAMDVDGDALEHAKVRGTNRSAPSQDKYARPEPTLHWMRRPTTWEGEPIRLERIGGMPVQLKAALETCGIQQLFPIQVAMWTVSKGGCDDQHDLCINAATGSGKTLSYAIPVCQVLLKRKVPRLRALVVLPTKDLALQVYTVFADLCTTLGLRVAVAAGAEQDSKHWGKISARLEYHTQTDILVATPGRLVGLLERFPGFTLEHLRFLVVDESDRLLRQTYQDWLPKTLLSMKGRCHPGDLHHQQEPMVLSPRPVKIVLSATLTRDPAKLGKLELHHPRYITLASTSQRYKLPTELKEFKIVCDAEEKFLTLVKLLHNLENAGPTIVFTASVEATHELYLLLTAIVGLPVSVVEYSSYQTQAQRTRALEDFRSREAQVIVASDAMTRGMDVLGVAVVVNFDTPVYAKTYVHRAGRTARAGAQGAVYTILRKEEVRHFKAMLRKADNNYVNNYKLSRDRVEGLAERVALAEERVKLFTQRASVGRTKQAVSMELADLNTGALWVAKRQIASNLALATEKRTKSVK
eukprot:scaffold840_cov344-Pavlova_lutheri.AAC.60